MNSKSDQKQRILSIISKINDEYPELSKYIMEIPIINSDTKEEAIITENLEEYHNSLIQMFAEYSKTHDIVKAKKDIEKIKLPGYPKYSASSDIYNRGKKEMKLNPSELSKNKTPNEKTGHPNEKGFKDDMSGDDLDVPGSELDDQQESVGSEDEENNYYSLGGDNHHNLDENK